jgi:pyruvate formate lyase activating enzyme
LHFSGFTPMYKMRHLPPTSLQALESARDIAAAEGLEYIYIGNRQSENGENTYCPQCRKLLIQRVGFAVLQNRLKEGHCPDCSKEIYGIWK